MAAVKLNHDAYPLALQKLHFINAVIAVPIFAEHAACHAVDIAIECNRAKTRIIFGVVFGNGNIVAEDILLGHEAAQRGDIRHTHRRLFRTEARQIGFHRFAVIIEHTAAYPTEERAQKLGIVRRAADTRCIRCTAVRTGGQEGTCGIEITEDRRNAFERGTAAGIMSHVFVTRNRVFVITGPPCKTRMIAQGKSSSFRFMCQFFDERVVFFGILSASH